MRQLKKGISLSLDEDVIKELQEFAEEQDRSLSQAINMILKKFILKRARTMDLKEQKMGMENER